MSMIRIVTHGQSQEKEEKEEKEERVSGANIPNRVSEESNGLTFRLQERGIGPFPYMESYTARI